jgi:hypothetical protein
MAVDATTAVGSNSVTGAIRKAAQATGTSFDYLLATARVESDLNPNLTMRSSTATGLFQFIEQTWLGTLKQAGPAFGYGDYANAISQSASGRYVVADPALRNEIMQLRKDPAANALMGGVFTQQNAAVLARRLGRTPSEGELYIGHFFGPYAGAKAIALARSNPTANAAEVFPAAAGANRPIFYDKQGNARSVGGVCAELIRRYEVARAQAPATAFASHPPRPTTLIPSPAQIPAASAPRPAAPSPAPATAGLDDLMAFAGDTNAARASSPDAVPVRGDPAAGMFHSLFQTGERREAISPAISELWGGQARPQQASAPRTNPAGDGSAGGDLRLGLFRDR